MKLILVDLKNKEMVIRRPWNKWRSSEKRGTLHNADCVQVLLHVAYIILSHLSLTFILWSNFQYQLHLMGEAAKAQSLNTSFSVM